MKTAEEITIYLEQELMKANEQHNQFKGQDAHKAYTHLIEAATIQNLLEGIKAVEVPVEEEPPQFVIGHLEQKFMNGELTEEEYTKRKMMYIETLYELFMKDFITEDELRERINK
jgi:hypothetical protein